MDYGIIKLYLKEHHITRAKFAEDIGVSVYTVNNWFNRKPDKFPLNIALKINKLYKIPLDQIVATDALELLEYQEPVDVICDGVDFVGYMSECEARKSWKCSWCGFTIFIGNDIPVAVNYCWHCGRRLNWNE